VFDLVIIGGTVVDGSGKEGFRADVGIEGEKIAALGQFTPPMGRLAIAAEKLVVAPGFIDPHTHSDFTILQDPYAESKIRQGVTTEIGGNCGFSVFPVNAEVLPAVKDYTKFFPGEISWEWADYPGYLRKMEERGIACNFGSHVGHGMVRLCVKGFSGEPLRAGEIELMGEHLRAALTKGALGLSLGLAYAPGAFADLGELIPLGRVTREFPQTLIAVHLRDEGDGVTDSVREVIEVAEKAELPVHICHHKATGIRNFGKVETTLGMMAEAKKKGLDVTCDVYPYTAANTTLVSLFPKEDLTEGIKGLMNKLKNPAEGDRIAAYLQKQAEQVGGWDNIRIATVKSAKNKGWEGKNIAEIGAARKTNEAAALMELCFEEEGAVNVVLFYVREEDLEAVMRHPQAMFGSDGKILRKEGPLGEGKPHPRNFGAYPRALGRYVRERKVLSLPEAIQKMTSLPAQRLFIEKRGLIREGYCADLTLFDPERVRDMATFDFPQQYPEGIEYVIVNGQVVLEKGQRTKALPGKIIKRQ
jgi:N-acyl-D-amino-acid deacylase